MGQGRPRARRIKGMDRAAGGWPALQQGMTDPASGPSASGLSWRDLETRVGLDALPEFHRAFLEWSGAEGVAEMPLRRVGQRVEAELNRMVKDGRAVREGEDWRLIPGALEGFEAAAPYLPQEPSSLPV